MYPNHIPYGMVLCVLNQLLKCRAHYGQMGLLFFVERFNKLSHFLPVDAGQMGDAPNPPQPWTRLFGFIRLLNQTVLLLLGLLKRTLHLLFGRLELVCPGRHSWVGTWAHLNGLDIKIS
jgi:hypothetical protein